MRLQPESNRLLAGEFDSECRHRAKPVNEGAAGTRMVHGVHPNSAWQAPEWCIIMRDTQSIRREYGYE